VDFSPGRFKTQWDWIRYRSSDNGGTSWSDETIALTPTPGTDDAWSVCDPGAVKIGEYYYIGYTSCYNVYGRDNNVFVARSKNVYGPFNEKWNGQGWSTSEAQPVVYFRRGRDRYPQIGRVRRGRTHFRGEDGVIDHVPTPGITMPRGRKEITACAWLRLLADDENLDPPNSNTAASLFERGDGEAVGQRRRRLFRGLRPFHLRQRVEAVHG